MTCLGREPQGTRFLSSPRRRPLGRQRYLIGVAAGLALAALQILLLPRWLSAEDFALVVLGISGTQAALSFGDLGYGYASISAAAGPAVRAHRREQSVAVMHVTCATFFVIVCTMLGLGGGTSVVAVALGVLTGLVLNTSRMRAATHEAAGDEVAAMTENLVWQNAPKLGMLLLAAFTREGLVVIAGGLLLAMIVGRPVVGPRWRGLLSVPREVRTQAPAFLAISCSFALLWADTYFIAGSEGLNDAGSYQAVYRVIAAVTYLYLPLGSVLTARLNHRVPHALRRLTFSAVAMAGVGALLACAFTYAIGPHLWSSDIVVNPSLFLPLGLGAVLAAVSYLAGQTLLVRGRMLWNAGGNLAAAAVAVTGHLVFTLRGGPVTAAWVSCVGMATAAVGQTLMTMATSDDDVLTTSEAAE